MQLSQLLKVDFYHMGMGMSDDGTNKKSMQNSPSHNFARWLHSFFKIRHTIVCSCGSRLVTCIAAIIAHENTEHVSTYYSIIDEFFNLYVLSVVIKNARFQFIHIYMLIQNSLQICIYY